MKSMLFLSAEVPTSMLAQVERGGVFGAVKMMLLGLALCWLGVVIAQRLSRLETRSLLVNLFLASFVVRIISSLLLLHVVPLLVHNHPYLSLGMLNDDAGLFDQLAVLGADAILAGSNPLDAYALGRTGAVAYLFVMTFTYMLVGHELFAVQIVNSFFGSLIPIFGFLIAETFLSFSQSRLAAILMAFYPEQILYSGSQQKDISIVLAFIFGLWLVSRVPTLTTRRQQVLVYLLLAGAAGFLALSRFYYTFLLGLGLALGFIPDVRALLRLSFRQIVQRALIVGVMMGVMVALIALVLPNGLELFQSPLAAAMFFYQTFASGSGDSGSLYVLFGFPYNIILFPLPLLGFLLNPFILWPFISPAAIYWILFPTMVAWYLILPFVVYGFGASNRPGFGRTLMLVVAATVFILIIIGSGLNTAGRSKLPLQPFALMYAVIGFEAFRQNRPVINWITGTYAVGLGGLIVVYFLLKLPIPLTVMVMVLLPNVLLVALIAFAVSQHARTRNQSPTLAAPDSE